MVTQNSGASLIDLGDGVLCVEFHSKMNTIGEDTIAHAVRWAGRNADKNFEAMVIANEGENFSVGANLMMVLLAPRKANGTS